MRQLEDWLKAYMLYTRTNEAPEHFHFWVGVGNIAAALRRKVWIDMGDWQWYPNFYIIMVAEPGIVNKSTTMRIGKRLLVPNEAIKLGPSSITWQALIGELDNAREEVLMEDGFYVPMSCLSFFISEFGTFMDFMDRKLVDVLVDLWDGDDGAWNRATQGRGLEGAVNPWINIIAGTTPSWLADNLPRKMIGGGFASRCIWLHGEKKKAYIAYPTRSIHMPGKSELKEKLIEDLADIAALRGEFKLTEEAYIYGENWYKKHSQLLETHVLASQALKGYFSRKQAHIHKLAMVLSASSRRDMIIDEKELRAAVQIIDAVEQDYPRIFQSITTTVVMEQTWDIVKIVLQEKKIARSVLYQKYFFHQMNAKEFADALQSCIEAQYIELVQEGSTLYVLPGRQGYKHGETVGKSQPSSD